VICLPAVKWLLTVAVLWLVLAFGSSEGLASVHGNAVTGAMPVYTALAVTFAHRGWRLPLWLAPLMAGWRRGTQLSIARSGRDVVRLEELAERMQESSAHRVPGVAIFLMSPPAAVPPALLHNLKHTGYCISTITSSRWKPWVSPMW
jgi:KUP system potassium uptake protein